MAGGRILLLRHGQTEWSQQGKHTGLTDVPLTEAGEEQAREAGRRLAAAGWRFQTVVSSPLQRALRTAQLAGFEGIEVDSQLREWDYGAYEGRTTAEIRRDEGPNWTVIGSGVKPGATPGESIEQVAARVERALAKLRDTVNAGGDVAVVGHGHALRILATVWLAAAPRFASRLILDAGAWGVLGDEHGVPALVGWNLT